MEDNSIRTTVSSYTFGNIQEASRENREKQIVGSCSVTNTDGDKKSGSEKDSIDHSVTIMNVKEKNDTSYETNATDSRSRLTVGESKEKGSNCGVSNVILEKGLNVFKT